MARINERQKHLFQALEGVGTVSLAIGPQGITCHVVDYCYITETETEDRLDFGNGTHHMHIDWARLKRATCGIVEGRAAITFQDGDLVLFRIYKPDGDFPEGIRRMCGQLIFPGDSTLTTT